MPVHYPEGIIREDLWTRKRAGLFVISHIGRFAFRESGAIGPVGHIARDCGSTAKMPRCDSIVLPYFT